MASNEEVTEIVPPAIYNHSVAVYDAMESTAENIQVGKTDEERGIVWTGFTTKLFADLGLSVPYYSQCLKMLKGMDCIRQLRRGGGGSPSQWLLMQRPTAELYEYYLQSNPVEKQGTSRVDQLEQQVRDLAKMVQGDDGEEVADG